MLPGLASRVHDADATLHDNTYKRVFGEWKEWEVVMWDKRLNQLSTQISIIRQEAVKLEQSNKQVTTLHSSNLTIFSCHLKTEN